MGASATGVKELNVLTCYNPLNVSHSASSKKKKNLRPVLDWMREKGSYYSERTKNKCRKTTANVPVSSGNEAVVSSSSKYDKQKKKTWTVLKLSRPTLFLP
jgi:hypothetical protein